MTAPTTPRACRWCTSRRSSARRCRCTREVATSTDPASAVSVPRSSWPATTDEVGGHDPGRIPHRPPRYPTRRCAPGPAPRCSACRASGAPVWSRFPASPRWRRTSPGCMRPASTRPGWHRRTGRSRPTCASRPPRSKVTSMRAPGAPMSSSVSTSSGRPVTTPCRWRRRSALSPCSTRPRPRPRPCSATSARRIRWHQGCGRGSPGPPGAATWSASMPRPSPSN